MNANRSGIGQSPEVSSQSWFRFAAMSCAVVLLAVRRRNCLWDHRPGFKSELEQRALRSSELMRQLPATAARIARTCVAIAAGHS